VTLPAHWLPAAATASAIRGLDPKTTAVFSLFTGLRAHGLVMFGQPDDPTLIPGALRETLAQTPPKPRTGLLAGRAAWLYAGLPLNVRDALMDVTVVPTTAGVLTIACVASPSVWAAASRCASDVQEIALKGAESVAPAQVSSQVHLLAALTVLDRALGSPQKELLAARLPADQAKAAEKISVAYRAAVRSMPPLADDRDAATIVALLGRIGDDYQLLAGAASAGRRRQYDAARAAIRKSEAALAEALTQLRRN
jgi:hypothetical protein